MAVGEKHAMGRSDLKAKASNSEAPVQKKELMLDSATGPSSPPERGIDEIGRKGAIKSAEAIGRWNGGSKYQSFPSYDGNVALGGTGKESPDLSGLPRSEKCGGDEDDTEQCVTAGKTR